MNILYLGKYYYPFSGGIETTTRNLAEGMVMRGHKVTVLCLASSDREKDGIVHGVKVLRFPEYIKPGLIPSKVSCFLRQQKQGFDIVHLHSPNLYMGLGYFFSSLKQPLVVSCHSDQIFSTPSQSVARSISLEILTSARTIVVGTKQHIRYSLILPLFRKKCRVIPFGIDPKVFTKTKEVAARERKNLRRYGKYILFVGRLWEYKGLQYLLKAMKEIDVHLVIVGRGAIEKKMKALSRSYGVARKISFVNNVEDPIDLSAFYHGSQMLVLPSQSPHEAFGLVQLEAMACGKPVVVSGLDSGVRFIQQENLTGLYCIPRNSKDLALKINSLLCDDAKRKSMGIAAKKRFKKFFMASRMIDEYEKLYKEIKSE